jgi:hypothetical protein
MNVAPRVCAGDVNKLGRESDFVEVRVAPGKRDEQWHWIDGGVWHTQV